MAVAQNATTHHEKHAIIATLVFMAPVLVEAFRKYLYYSHIPFIILYIFYIYMMIQTLIYRRDLSVVAFCFLPIASWSILLFLIGRPEDWKVLVLGLASYAIPFVAIVVGRGSAGHAYLALTILTVVQVVGAGLGALQILAGVDHPINYMPIREAPKMASYGAEIWGIHLFRPASLYMHAGKFGFVTSIIAVFRIILLSRQSVLSAISGFLAVDMPALIVTGQRTGMMLCLIVLCHMILSESRVRDKKVGRAALASGFFIVTVFLLFAVAYDLVRAGMLRLASAVEEIPSRVAGNIVGPLGDVVQEYGLLGAGAGAYAAASQRLLGASAENYVFTTAESSWYRMMAELGLVGEILFIICIVVALLSVRVESRCRRDVATMLMVMVVWGFVHDVWNNYIGLWISFILVGLLAEGGRKATRMPNLSENPSQKLLRLRLCNSRGLVI